MSPASVLGMGDTPPIATAASAQAHHQVEADPSGVAAMSLSVEAGPSGMDTDQRQVFQ